MQARAGEEKIVLRCRAASSDTVTLERKNEVFAITVTAVDHEKTARTYAYSVDATCFWDWGLAGQMLRREPKKPLSLEGGAELALDFQHTGACFYFEKQHIGGMTYATRFYFDDSSYSQWLRFLKKLQWPDDAGLEPMFGLN